MVFSLFEKAAVAQPKFAEKTEIMVLSQADFKKLFAKESNEVEGFERVAELLQIDSGARSKDQLDELAQLLTKTSSFFQTLEPTLHYDICQAASYKQPWRHGLTESPKESPGRQGQ